jgi:hypothetical protein
MGKTKRFEIEHNEPQGATFQGNRTPIDVNRVTKQSKKAARFGIMDNEPAPDATFEHAGSHIDFPKADKAGPEYKDVYESSIGKYSPKSASGQVTSGTSFGGRSGIGGSAPKKGGGNDAMKPMREFKK